MDTYQTNEFIGYIRTIAMYFEKKNNDYYDVYQQQRDTAILTDISNALQGIESRLESLSAELIERAFINAQRDIMEKQKNDTTEGVSRLH